MAGRDGRFLREREGQSSSSGDGDGVNWGDILGGLVVGGAAAAAAYTWWSSGSTKNADSEVRRVDDKDDEQEMIIIANACPDRAGGIIKFEIRRRKYVWHYSVNWQRLRYSRNPGEQESSDMEVANALLATFIARQAMDQFGRGVAVTIKLDNNVIREHHPIWTEIQDLLGQVPRRVQEEKRTSLDMKNADTLSRGSWREWQAGQSLTSRTHYSDRQGVEKNDEAEAQLSALEILLRRCGKHPGGPRPPTGLRLQNAGWLE